MPFDLTPLERGVLYTRPELATLWGYQGYQAFARGVFTPRMAQTIVLFVTREKQVGLTAYKDMLVGDHLTWEGEAAHSTDERIARAAERGESIHLFYRDVHHTPFRYHGEILLTRFSQRRDQPSRFEFRLVRDLSAFDDLNAHSNELMSLPSTEREQVTRARVGQGRFRDSLLKFWQGCAVTGVNRADLIRASHIKPWRLSDNAERLDPHNGLLLLPQYDHLFDAGYISFDDDGRLVESPAIADLNPSILGFDRKARLRRVTEEHREFLDFHRSRLFLRSA